MPAVVLYYCTFQGTVLKESKCFIFCACLFFMYFLCEKYDKPIPVQYYRADCVSWVPRLTFLDLRTDWTSEHALGTELVCM